MVIRLVAILFMFFSAVQPALSQDISDARIKELALEAILENPEILMQAVEILRQQEATAHQTAVQSALEESLALLESDANAPVLGNTTGDVTIVEFFDYNCPYCKRAKAEVLAALEADENIRLVLREWPILGPASVEVAQVALAAQAQGKYAEVHNALMEHPGRTDLDIALSVAKELGLDIEKLKNDMESDLVTDHIETSLKLAQKLGLTGTPSYVIGGVLLPGFLDKTDIEFAINEARSNL